MTVFTKIAWRNITRHRARSLLTISAVAVGLCALIFLKAFVDGADYQMVENYTDLLIGHIQIHRQGFHQDMSLEKTINNPRRLSGLVKTLPGVKAVSWRVKNYALISSAESSVGILLLGVDPDTEKSVSTLFQKVKEGRFLSVDDNDKIIIGRQLATNLKAGIGDKIVLMSQAADGSMAGSAFFIQGIMETGAEEIDKNLALVTLKASQDFLVLEDRVHELVVKAHSLKTIDALTEAIKQKINSRRIETLNWKEISPMTYQWLQFDFVFVSLILLIVLVVVASGILNTLLMGVLERTREFGIMLAIGTKPAQIVTMVTTESILLSSCGGAIGLGLGIGLVYVFGAIGIDLSAISSALNSNYIGSVIYPRADFLWFGIYAATVFFLSLLIAVIPAAKASKLSPIEAIRNG